jgi:hypothetical protein
VGSGVVYGVIVALWAVVLVPMWLRRHDAANETRSADRFSHAMRTLSPRNTPGQRDVVMPARAPETTRPVVSGPGVRVAARRSLARRRRRVLLALVATVAVLAAVAAFGVVPWLAVAIPVVLLVVYVVNLRAQAKRSSATSALRRRAPAAAREARQTPNASPAPVPDSSIVVETKGERRLWRSVPAGMGHPLVTEQLVTQRLAQARTAPAAHVPADEQVTEVLAVEQTVTEEPQEGTWEPAEFPLPTYVTAPKAVRPVRVIDLTSPGAWTSGRFLEESIPEAEEAVDQAMAEADAAEGELDALLERRPAVND